MFLAYVPLMVVPLLLYNAFAFAIFGDWEAGFADAALFTVPMVSGASFTLTVSATIILMALVLLFFEILKSTRIGSANIVDHAFATLILLVYVLEFFLVARCATSTFLVLTAIALIDLLSGFAVSLRSATRDVSVG
jgi:hypothetical protein